ncbi:MAG: protein tyrosine phosphatase family protein [Caldilineaceae bacterium]
MAESQLTQIYNFLPINERWATAGQPTAAQFVAIQQAGYEVVINLAMPDSPNALAGEEQLVEALNMAYCLIPVVWEAPTEAKLKQFFRMMDAHEGKKRFVHCIANMRVSAFSFLYRVIRLGVPIEQAERELFQIWHPNPIWQSFINSELEKRNIPGIDFNASKEAQI